MENIFYRYNPWWEEEFQLKDIIQRDKIIDKLKNSLASKLIVFITGLRRVGKTTLMKLFIKHLIKNENIDSKYIFYISLDEYLLFKKNILEIIDEYRKIQGIPFKDKIYVFLDEIGYKEDYEIQLKNIVDSQNVKIYASSSSASILKNKKPFLTGRNILIEVLPLDFKEYLQFKNIKISKSDKHLLEKHFDNYLTSGGIPEYVLHNNIEYIRELVDDIIGKDITGFYKVKNSKLLKEFFMLLMERAGKKVSINKVGRILKISPDTANRYLQMFADTYLIYLVARYGKTNEGILAPKKVYSADLGIRTIFTGVRDKGSLFENYIYLKIKERNPKYVYKDETEIDFITEDKMLVEVKYMGELTDKQKILFDQVKAREKIIIKNIDDVEKIEN